MGAPMAHSKDDALQGHCPPVGAGHVKSIRYDQPREAHGYTRNDPWTDG